MEGKRQMMTNQHAREKRQRDHGVSLLIIAASMIFVLGMAGLGIDLASMYVARNQAQRAADAAALAAAQALATCTDAPGGTISPDCQSGAKLRAVTVGNANFVAGGSPNISDADVKFLSLSTNDPQVQVIAARDTSHGNPMPTFFIKIFGIDSANVSARAVAEAYNPSGGPVSTSGQCIKPWLMPNCDWDHAYDPNNPQGYLNPNCSGNVQFVDVPYPTPPPGSTSLQQTKGVLPDSETRGETLIVKSSDPSKASGPSQFYPVFLPVNSQTPSVCPSCALTPGGGGASSGALYSENISCCNTTPITCGSQTIQPITGNMVGPTANGVDCLIHEQGSSGQDTFSTDPNTLLGTPWTITAGSNNPYNVPPGSPIASSDSIVTVPLYDGSPLCPGNSCPSQVTTTVVGFMQLFVEGESHGNVTVRVMNVLGCGGSSGGGGGSPGGPIPGGAASPIAVRLIND